MLQNNLIKVLICGFVFLILELAQAESGLLGVGVGEIALPLAGVELTPDLNSEVTLDLMSEVSLPDARRPNRDVVEIGYTSRALGHPSLATPFQTTTYDFSDKSAPAFAYRTMVSEKPNLYWSNRVAYFDIEQSAYGALPTRLHVVPLQTELMWQLRRGSIAPFVAVGVLGILQVQRGAQAVQSSELTALWSGRAGLNLQFKSFLTDSPLGLSISRQEQDNWAERGHEWSGSGYDLSLSMAL